MTKIHFTEQDWQRVRHDTDAWWAGELDRPLVYLAVTRLAELTNINPPLYSYWSNYPLEMPASEIVDRFDPVFSATHFYGDAFPWWWLNFGPGIAAGFLGADVHSVYEPSETVWFSYPEKIQLKDLHLAYDANGAIHFSFRANAQGLAGITPSGVRYHATRNLVVENNGDGLPFTSTAIQSFNLVSEGSADNYLLHVTSHTTINANGEATVEIVNSRLECKP